MLFNVNKLPPVNVLLAIVNGLVALEEFQSHSCAKSPLAIVLAAVAAVKFERARVDDGITGEDHALPFYTNSAD